MSYLFLDLFLLQHIQFGCSGGLDDILKIKLMPVSLLGYFNIFFLLQAKTKKAKNKQQQQNCGLIMATASGWLFPLSQIYALKNALH